MEKVLNLNKPVAELISEFPELKDTMVTLGFKQITNPAALKTVGKVMTIPKGAQMKGFDLDEVIAFLEEEGYTVQQ